MWFMFLGSVVATVSDSQDVPLVIDTAIPLEYNLFNTMLLSFEEGRMELDQARTTLSKKDQEIKELNLAIDQLRAELLKREQENNVQKLQNNDKKQLKLLPFEEGKEELQQARTVQYLNLNSMKPFLPFPGTSRGKHMVMH